MASQCFRIVDEYGNPVQNARINVIVGNTSIFSNFTNSLGQLNCTVTECVDNLIYVRYNSYTPVQYVYNGNGGEPCIELSIHSCKPLQQQPLEDGRFLVWNPISYCIREQTEGIKICGDDRSTDNVSCDRFDTEDGTDYYPLPVKNNDVIRWVMDKSEVDYDDDLTENLRIGISKNGILVTEDIGTITESEGQLFCEANIPCLLDCEYEFIIYRIDLIDFIGVEITSPTAPSSCDGQIKVVVALGTPPYEYSLDGVNWQTSDTFTGLCGGSYDVYARDSDCSQGYKKAIVQTINCADYKGYTLQQVIDTGVTLGQLIDAGCTLCDFVPVSGESQNVLFSNDNWQLDGDVTFLDGTLSFTGAGEAIQTFTAPPNTALTITSTLTDASGSIDYSFEVYDDGSFYTQYTDTAEQDLVLSLPATAHTGNLTLRISPRDTFNFKASNTKIFVTVTC